jgi:hypothetical protein
LKKTGGIWDPNSPFIFFFAGNPSDYTETEGNSRLIALNDVHRTFDVIYEQGGGLETLWFLDSGVYSLAMEHARRHSLSFDEAIALPPAEIFGFDVLFDRYVQFVQEHEDRLWGYVEIDFGGAVWKRKTRAKLEGLGLAPIPVYHPLVDGWDYFDELAQEYDRICVANLVQAEAPVRKRIIATAWERSQDYPNLWVHLLGYTPSELLNAYPANSADSSTWLNVVRWHGVSPKGMLRSIGRTGPEFKYQLGNREQWTKTLQMSSYATVLEMQGYLHFVDLLEDEGIEQDVAMGREP